MTKIIPFKVAMKYIKFLRIFPTKLSKSFAGKKRKRKKERKTTETYKMTE